MSTLHITLCISYSKKPKPPMAVSILNLMAEGAVQQFCERVRSLLPEHGHLPNYKEVGRMAVLSFAKRVAMWNEDNAPVTGYRFRDYLSIALQTGRLLGGLGGMLPAEVLKMLNELLEQLHQADYINHGSKIEFVYVASGGQHVETQVMASPLGSPPNIPFIKSIIDIKQSFFSFLL